MAQAQLIDMEKVAGRYEPKHELMQDAPSSTFDGRVNIKGGKVRGLGQQPKSVAPASIKNTSTVNNVYQSEHTKVQTEAINAQTAEIRGQTDLMRKQGQQLGNISRTMSELYGLIHRQATKITPKMQETPKWNGPDLSSGASNKDDKVDFGSVLGDFSDLFGRDGGRDRKRKPDRSPRKTTARNAKIGSTVGDAFKSGFGKIKGLGEALMRNGSNFKGGGLRGLLMKAAVGATVTGASYLGFRSKLDGADSAAIESAAPSPMPASVIAPPAQEPVQEPIANQNPIPSPEPVAVQKTKPEPKLEPIQSPAESVKPVAETKEPKPAPAMPKTKAEFPKPPVFHSYGNHELNPYDGSLQKFFESQQGSQFAAEFKGMTPGTPAFDKKWDEIHGSNTSFRMAQRAFVKMLELTNQPIPRQTFFAHKADETIAWRKEVQRLLKLHPEWASEAPSEYRTAKNDNKEKPVANLKLEPNAESKPKEPEQVKLPSSEPKQEADPKSEQDVAPTTAPIKSETAPLPSIDLTKSAEAPAALPPAKKEEVVDSAKAEIEKSVDAIVSQPSSFGAVEAAGLGVAGAGVVHTATKAPSAVSEVAKNNLIKGGVVRTGARALPLIGNIGVGAYEAYEVIKDDKLAKEEKERALVGVGGGMAGSAAGAAAGAAIGSMILPLVGTAIGGLIGGGLGYFLGQNGAEKTMDVALGTPEERRKKAAEAQGEKAELEAKPLIAKPDGKLEPVEDVKPLSLAPSIEDSLESVKPELEKQVTASEAVANSTKVEKIPVPVIVPSATPTTPVVESKQMPIVNDAQSPASSEYYKTEPVISQKSHTSPTSIASKSPSTSAVTQTVAPENAQRHQYDTVKNVRMALDSPIIQQPPQTPQPATQQAAPQSPNNKPTLDDIPALINDFGLIFVNSGYL